MSTEFPEQYTQEQFDKDLERTIMEVRSMGDTHFHNFNSKEKVTDPETRNVFKKFIDNTLTPSDIESYREYLFMLPEVSENQKEIIEFLRFQAQRRAPAEAAGEVEKRLEVFRGAILKIVKESQSRGESHFSSNFNVDYLGLTDMDMYERYRSGKLEDSVLTERLKSTLGSVQREFTEYLRFLLSERDRLNTGGVA